MFARWPRFVHCLVLPAGLLLASGWGLGTYFETSDDLAIIQLVRGITAAVPVSNLHFYFHGLAAVLAVLCQQWPAVPWYATLLFVLLYGATALAFAVIDKLLRGRVPAWQITLLLLLFYSTLWLEHAMWFHFGRVAVLLAGSGLLFAAQRPTQRWAQTLGLSAFGLAWLIWPGAADVALLAVLPGLWWLTGRRAAPLIVAAIAWAVVAGLALHLLRPASSQAYRQLHQQATALNDYRLYRLAPASATDSLGLRLAASGMLGDSTLVNEALFRRAAHFEPTYFGQHVAPAKLQATVFGLIREYFPALLVLATLAAWVLAHADMRGRPGFWLALLAWAGLLLGLGTLLRLPPHLALPLLDLLVLSAVVFVLRDEMESERRAVRALLLVLGIAALPYTVKTLRRHQQLRAEQHRGLQQLRQMRRHTYPAAVVVTDVLDEAYKSQSPWGRPRLGEGVGFLSVTGWYTADPSQAQLRRYLTGTTDMVPALRQLARRRAAVKWYLTPATARLLNQQLARDGQSGQQPWQLVARERTGAGSSTVPRLYFPTDKPVE
ncbi:hypothetical protein [Hymenobacter guriensis]|uniref:Glycosyltransferase RgtA/B/C/D-like domain-containing protein n=1 Tax=Hymenobacter guriensis TaxID=2793065 RepID=A0ABS0L2P2_9BACT|nr:hypothetical protein [Hymenobacter guriensis]MBG8553652.1 hypothetical protein [Hymenobacter guriensis]